MCAPAGRCAGEREPLIDRAPTEAGGALTVFVESCPDIEFDSTTGQLMDADDSIAILFGGMYPGTFKNVVYSGHRGCILEFTLPSVPAPMLTVAEVRCVPLNRGV